MGTYGVERGVFGKLIDVFVKLVVFVLRVITKIPEKDTLGDD